jgi:hypothetical protein
LFCITLSAGENWSRALVSDIHDVIEKSLKVSCFALYEFFFVGWMQRYPIDQLYALVYQVPIAHAD